MNSMMVLQGILPLVVFAIVDIFAGLRAAIVAAMVFATAEAIWSYYQFGEIDHLTWASMILVLVMGAIAFKMRNDKLFKFQPVAMSALSAGALIYFQIFETPLMVQMMPKMAPLMPEAQRAQMSSPEMIALIARLDTMMIFVFIAHGLLVAWAAMRKSTLYWLILRGAGFYGLLLLVLLINLILGLPAVR